MANAAQSPLLIRSQLNFRRQVTTNIIGDIDSLGRASTRRIGGADSDGSGDEAFS